MIIQKHPACYDNDGCNSCDHCFNSIICNSEKKRQIKSKKITACLPNLRLSFN